MPSAGAGVFEVCAQDACVSGVLDAGAEGAKRDGEAQDARARVEGEGGGGLGEGDEEARMQDLDEGEHVDEEQSTQHLPHASHRRGTWVESEKGPVQGEKCSGGRGRGGRGGVPPAGCEATGRETANSARGGRKTAPPDLHVISTSGLVGGEGHQEPLNRWRSLPNRPGSGPATASASSSAACASAAASATAPISAPRQGAAAAAAHQEPLDFSLGFTTHSCVSALHATASRPVSETGGRRGGKALVEMRDRRDSARQTVLSVGGTGVAGGRAGGGESGLTLELAGSKAALSVSRPRSKGQF
jgi:hypothetical protein